jgi:hypothetical protein
VTVRAIVGRLSDLGPRELFKLLASAEAEGCLRIDTPAGHADLLIRPGEVSGKVTPPLVLAYSMRSGSFSFRPEPVVGEGWVPTDDFLLLIEARAGKEEAREWVSLQGAPPGPTPSADPLGELRDSLAEIPLPHAVARVLVVSSDPRPDRSVEGPWRRRGWELTTVQEPRWPDGEDPDVLVLHLPSAGTLAGQEPAWLGLVRRASSQMPPIPTLWIGGMADPELRHRAITAGADFLLPGPMGEVGEAARWFRDEVTLIVERLLSHRTAAAESAAEAFRDYFLVLHVDASPAELRASLLRVAATSFRRGVLLAVRKTGFETLGGFGLGQGGPRHLTRGAVGLEQVVGSCRAIRCSELDASLRESLSVVLPGGCAPDGEILPLLAGAECVGVFAGDGQLLHGESTAGLAMLFARSGSVVTI